MTIFASRLGDCLGENSITAQVQWNLPPLPPAHAVHLPWWAHNNWKGGEDPSYWEVSQTCNNARRSGYNAWLLACQPVCLLLAANLWQNKPYSHTGIIPTMCCTYMRPYPTVIKVMAHHLRPRTKYLCIHVRHTHTRIFNFPLKISWKSLFKWQPKVVKLKEKRS